MVKFKLGDVEEDDFGLLGIHSTQPLYHLAYQINASLSCFFKRTQADKRITTKYGESQLSLFHYYDPLTDTDFYLCPNKMYISTAEGTGLFASEQKSEIQYTLMKTKTKADYLLKIAQEPYESITNQWLQNLHRIAAIQAVYALDHLQVKSNDHLIFD